MLKFIKLYKVEIAIFFIAFAARLIFFLVCLHANAGDLITTIRGQDGYFDLSRNLLLGNGFSINPEAPFLPYSYGVPGYSYFIYFILWFTGSYKAVTLVQIITGSLIPILGMHISRQLVSKLKKIPTIVGVLLALAPYQVLFSFIFYTEAFFTFVFSLFLIVIINFLKNPKTNSAILAGLLLGLSTLIKPTVEYLPIVVIVLSLWYFRANLKSISIKLGYFLLMFMLVLTPWIYRNYKTFDMVGLGSAMPFNLYEVLLPSVLAINNNTSFAFEQQNLPIDAAVIFYHPPKSISHDAIVAILKHPIALVKLSILSGFTFFTHDGMLTFMQAARISPVNYLKGPAILMLINSPVEFIGTALGYMKTPMAFVLLTRLFWILMTVSFIAGLYSLLKRKMFNAELVFVTIVVVYFMLTTMVNGLAVNARFRMPVETLIFVIACVGVSNIPIFNKKSLNSPR
jgi:hypothetical protein